MVSTIPLHPGKIYRPPLPADHLPRPELIALLEQAASRRLVMVCAPAGFGKSTLAIELCEGLSASRRSVWISLDHHDALAGQLLHSLIAGLRTLYPELGEPELALLQQSHSEQPLALEQLTLSVLDKLNQRHPAEQSVVLVLDDYHLAQNPQCDRLCALLLERLPASFQLLLTSRQRPDWHLARLRVAGKLLEIGEAQLRLNEEAAAAFLSRAGMVANDPEWSRHMVERNEGWIAGLRLATVAAEQAAAVGYARNLPVMPGPLIGEYLLEEVLQSLPERVRQFLFAIAWLDRFSAQLCDRVRDRNDSREIIDFLLQHKVFLVPLDQTGDWYRFHHLFSDFLLDQVVRTDLQQRQLAHARACQWFKEQGRISEAVEHALAAEMPEQAAGLVQSLPLDQLLAAQPVAMLLRWKAELPAVLQGSSAQLVLVHAWTLALACQLEDAEDMLSRLSRFMPQPNATGQATLIGQALVLRSYLARASGRISEAVELANQGLTCLADADAGSRLMAMLTLAEGELSRHQLEAARSWASNAIELAQRIGDPLFEAQVALLRARLLQARGKVERARQLITAQRTDLARRPLRSDESPIHARLMLYEAHLLSLQGERNVAGALLREGIAEARRHRDVFVLVGFCQQAALQAQVDGAVTEAFETLAEAERLMYQWDIPPVYYLGWITAIKSDLWISAGRQELAEQWLPRLYQTYCAEASAAPPPVYHALPVLVGLVQARLLWVQQEPAACEAQLQILLVGARRAGERLQELNVLVYLAWLQLEGGRPGEAEQTLRRALALAEDDRLIGCFFPLLRGAPAGLGEALRRAPESALREALCARLPARDAPDVSIPAAMKEPLSARELEVLRCIALGYSNQQISETLFISLHTVKSHARRINSKLGVARRTQAVAQAKTIGLLT
ncbi:LuxR C-terminal-related transcriptional regulator [Pseudomonas sp. OIL-1]|uniref:LuxR C-terminal-related transcriptional regulator n=1 Tax=Pseudomonas sp. OIL-1 TaxID=2706126 RepID=UPI0013A7A6DB|nr:LuxR C-terminal-related transcriptional regulator [Pseudomonas sp. OIL-1]QIB49708.1 helix-turn-helix transcriptional regulator [Pseudomonas sp. OIL-1]